MWAIATTCSRTTARWWALPDTSASAQLTPDKALVWRIVHRDNLTWIIDHGIHCANSAVHDPHYVSIGSPSTIGRRAAKNVPLPPGGPLADYVPFYFTPFSPMLLNIVTGRQGVQQRPKEEILILVTSLLKLDERKIPFVFTDRHALLQTAHFFDRANDVGRIDWQLLQNRDFRRDPEDPEKMERYQAEALVHRQVPLDALVGIMCYNQTVMQNIEVALKKRNLVLPVYARPRWYF